MSASRRHGDPVPPVIPGHAYLGPLGSGGYSTVYLYLQEKLDRKVAVKVLRDFGDDEATLRQFRAEAKAMAELGNHNNIVPVFESDIAADGQPYLTMPYYRGPNLATLVADGPLPVGEVLVIGVGIADAVHAAHRADIVHRDIKPANILTDEFGNRRLTDFGIAGRVVPVEADADFGVSVPWSPPEILRGGPGSVASDIYSLGATLWHLLMGHSPFEVVGGDNRRSSLEQRILTRSAPDVDRPDVPTALIRLLTEMLDRNPANRPRSAEDVSTTLDRIHKRSLPPTETLTDRAPRTPDPMPWAPPVRPLRPEAVMTSVRTTDPVPTHPDPAIHRTPAAARPAAWPPADTSRTRPRVVPEPEVVEAPDPDPPPGRNRVLVWTAAIVVAAAIGVGAVLAVGGGSPGAQPTPPAGTDGGDQQAGLLGENNPPGTPTVTAIRTDPRTLRFTWVYSAQLASDTFRWQTADGKRSGISQKPSVDLTDPAGKKLCVQVKVVRADGGNASVAWSPAGCGS